jgi:hypothetical protein
MCVADGSGHPYSSQLQLLEMVLDPQYRWLGDKAKLPLSSSQLHEIKKEKSVANFACLKRS